MCSLKHEIDVEANVFDIQISIPALTDPLAVFLLTMLLLAQPTVVRAFVARRIATYAKHMLLRIFFVFKSKSPLDILSLL